MTTKKWVTSLRPWDPGDPEAFSVVTSILVDLSLMAERKIDDARRHCSSRQDRREEQDSPPRSQAGASGVTQGGHAEERPQGPPVPRDQVPRSPEDQTLYSGSGVNPIYAIIITRKHKAYSDVFNAFTGHPKKHDPAHVKLRETGWAMAQRVFHPPQG